MTDRIAGLLARSAAEAGVVTTSTGPRRASSAINGVVRTVSPRNDVWMTSELVNLEDGEEGFLRNLYGAYLLHPLFSFLLFLEQLALARDVAAIALREHVLSQRLHRGARDHLVPDRRLNRHLEQL